MKLKGNLKGKMYSLSFARRLYLRQHKGATKMMVEITTATTATTVTITTNIQETHFSCLIFAILNQCGNCAWKSIIPFIESCINFLFGIFLGVRRLNVYSLALIFIQNCRTELAESGRPCTRFPFEIAQKYSFTHSQFMCHRSPKIISRKLVTYLLLINRPAFVNPLVERCQWQRLWWWWRWWWWWRCWTKSTSLECFRAESIV